MVLYFGRVRSGWPWPCLPSLALTPRVAARRVAARAPAGTPEARALPVAKLSKLKPDSPRCPKMSQGVKNGFKNGLPVGKLSDVCLRHSPTIFDPRDVLPGSPEFPEVLPAAPQNMSPQVTPLRADKG